MIIVQLKGNKGVPNFVMVMPYYSRIAYPKIDFHLSGNLTDGSIILETVQFQLFVDVSSDDLY